MMHGNMMMMCVCVCACVCDAHDIYIVQWIAHFITWVDLCMRKGVQGC